MSFISLEKYFVQSFESTKHLFDLNSRTYIYFGVDRVPGSTFQTMFYWEEKPLASRIVPLVGTRDALTSRRPPPSFPPLLSLHRRQVPLGIARVEPPAVGHLLPACLGSLADGSAGGGDSVVLGSADGD